MSIPTPPPPLATLLRWAGQWSRPLAVGALVLLLAAGWTVRRGIDDALFAMHLPGTVAAGGSQVAGVTSLLDSARTRSAIESWQAWSLDPGAATYLSPGSLLAGYAAVDVLLFGLPLTLLLLVGLRSAYRRALGRSHPLRDATVAVASWATLPAAVYLLAKVAADGLLLLAAASGQRWQVALLGAASLVAWLALGLAGLALVLAALAQGWGEGSMTAANLARGSVLAVFAPVIVLRAQVLTVGALVALLLLLEGDLGRQTQDVLLELPERPRHQVLAIVGGLVLAGLTAATGRWCERAYRRPPEAPPPGASLAPRVLWLAALTGLALISGGALLLTVRQEPAGWALLPPGALLLGFALLSAVPGVRSAWSGTSGVPASAATDTWLRVLVALPPTAIGLVALQGVVTLTVAREFGHAANLFALALVLIAAAALLFRWHPDASEVADGIGPGRTRPAAGRMVVPLLGLALVVAVAVWGAADPWAVGEVVGSLGILFAAFSLLLVVISGLVLAGDQWSARGMLAFLRVRRVPLVSLVLLCLVASSYLDTSWRYHDVRLSGAEAAGPGEPLTVPAAFDAWLAGHRPVGEPDRKASVPMLFIATGGGGIRAYYWTTTVLDCLFVAGECDGTLPAGSTRHVFAASGVSGGSVGLAAFRATGDGEHSARAVLHDGDFVAPVLAAMAFRDVPDAVLRADLEWLDRAGVLEVAWERSAAAQGHRLTDGFSQTSYTPAGQPRFPLLLFNGIAVGDGCRVTVSVLEAVPAESTDEGAAAPPRSCDSLQPFTDPAVPPPALARTRDAFDYTCRGDPANTPRDLRLSTAALLSARFPYVSPSGGLTSCADPDRRMFVLDGAIIESSGAGPLTDLWATLAPLVRQVNQDPDSGVCVDPRLVLIDNGYSDTRLDGLPRRPPELLAPLQASAEAAGRATAAARQAAALSFHATLGEVATCRQPDGTSRPARPAGDPAPVVQLYPRSHPGPLAPLGWTLSGWAQADLRGQLGVNADELDRIRSWFAPQG